MWRSIDFSHVGIVLRILHERMRVSQKRSPKNTMEENMLTGKAERIEKAVVKISAI